LEELDPNSDQIPKRGADSCKLQWATMTPEFSSKYSRWGQSGQMDTETFPDFCDSLPYLIYMLLKVMAGNPILMGQTLRFWPATISTDNLDLEGLCNVVNPGGATKKNNWQ
jgi:hypothetical protein